MPIDGNVPKKLGSYNSDAERAKYATADGNVPKKLGSYNFFFSFLSLRF